MTKDFIEQCRKRVTEIEVADVVNVLNVVPEGVKLAMVIRRLVFQRDQLETEVERLKGELSSD